MTKPWCVRHRDGWCAVADNQKPEQGAFSVPTRCGYYVTLPWGYERRVPTCRECERS